MKVALDYHPRSCMTCTSPPRTLYLDRFRAYNAWLDPIVVDEWHQLAYHEVDGMTREACRSLDPPIL